MRTRTLRASIAAAVLLGARPRAIATSHATRAGGPSSCRRRPDAFAVGTTTWRLTDPSRQETFTDVGRTATTSKCSPGIPRPRRGGQARAVPARGASPRCGRSRASFAHPKRRSTRSSMFGRTPSSMRRRLPTAAEAAGPRFLARVHRHPERPHGAARGSGQPRLRRPEHRPPLRGDRPRRWRTAASSRCSTEPARCCRRLPRSSASGAPKTKRWRR